MALPETVEIETSGSPSGSIIWLHGLGADGHDFEPIVPELRLPPSMGLRFVFPHAPVRPVTLNGGMAMRAWYDIYSLDAIGAPDEAGIRESAAMLEALVDREKARGVSSERIVLAGFSQGGAIASHVALRHPEPLAGLMALSTYLPLHRSVEPEVRDNDRSQPREMPVFMAHGQFDPVLSIDMGRQSRVIIEDLGFEVEWHDYPMAHGVCAEEIADIRDWLLRVLES